jgi:hypothetical protein
MWIKHVVSLSPYFPSPFSLGFFLSSFIRALTHLQGHSALTWRSGHLTYWPHDWSWICEPGDPSRLQDFVHKATGLRVVDEPRGFVTSDLLALRPRWGGFCMLLDAEEFGKEFLQAFVRDCPARRGLGLGADEAKERLFIRKREGKERDGDAIGAWMACDMTEYEFGTLQPYS